MLKLFGLNDNDKLANSDWLKAHALFTIQVTDGQIWKNFVFNEEMTAKMQPATG